MINIDRGEKGCFPELIEEERYLSTLLIEGLL